MTGSTNDQLRELVQHAGVHEQDHVPERATTPMVGFRVGARWFAVPAVAVREVVTLETITNIPNVRQHVLGVALIRGRLVPVVDLPGLLGVARTGEVAATRPRLVVVERGTDEACVVADETRGVLELAALGEGQEAGVVRGELRWNGHIIAVLDPAAVVGVVAPVESAR